MSKLMGILAQIIRAVNHRERGREREGGVRGSVKGKKITGAVKQQRKVEKSIAVEQWGETGQSCAVI